VPALRWTVRSPAPVASPWCRGATMVTTTLEVPFVLLPPPYTHRYAAVLPARSSCIPSFCGSWTLFLWSYTCCKNVRFLPLDVLILWFIPPLLVSWMCFFVSLRFSLVSTGGAFCVLECTCLLLRIDRFHAFFHVFLVAGGTFLLLLRFWIFL